MQYDQRRAQKSLGPLVSQGSNRFLPVTTVTSCQWKKRMSRGKRKRKETSQTQRREQKAAEAEKRNPDSSLEDGSNWRFIITLPAEPLRTIS